jgi:hypothetical protein
LGVLSEYKNKWKLLVILGLLTIRIVNLGYNIFTYNYNRVESPFIPDFIYLELTKPLLVLLAIYVLFLSMTVVFAKKIDSKDNLSELIITLLILFYVFMEDFIIDAIRTL